MNAVVELIIKSAILAARISGNVRKRSLKRLAAMDVDSKDKEITFLRDRVDQLKTQVSILQKGLRPDDVYHDKKPEKPGCEAKTVPRNIEQCFFRETKITSYQLKKTA